VQNRVGPACSKAFVHQHSNRRATQAGGEPMNSNKCDIPVRYPSRVRWVWYGNMRIHGKGSRGMVACSKRKGCRQRRGVKKGEREGESILRGGVSLFLLVGSWVLTHTPDARFFFF